MSWRLDSKPAPLKVEEQDSEEGRGPNEATAPLAACIQFYTVALLYAASPMVSLLEIEPREERSQLRDLHDVRLICLLILVPTPAAAAWCR